MGVIPTNPRVLVACPDARPPAYQAAVGLHRAGSLGEFITSSYYDPDRPFATLLRRVMHKTFARIERVLLRRHDPEIPSSRVRPVFSFDLALRLEAFLARKSPRLKRAVTRWRTARFDSILARRVRRDRPDAVLIFSDVGSGVTLPLCKKLGIPAILSMVHGDVREETEVLAAEAAVSSDFMPIYLADGTLDRDELAWLHQRRLQDIARSRPRGGSIGPYRQHARTSWNVAQSDLGDSLRRRLPSLPPGIEGRQIDM